MTFDPATLLMLMAIIIATVGMLLVFTWAQNPQHRALAIWGGADLIFAAAIGLLLTRNVAPGLVSIVLPFALIECAYGALWSAMRRFSGRPLRPIAMAVGPALWLVGCTIPALYQSSQGRVALISSIAAAYTLAAMYELWRDRGERLVSRSPMIACFVLHGGLLVVRTIFTLLRSLPSSADILSTPWLVATGIEPIILIIASGFLLLSMTKERAELTQRRAAATDALTGIASRRAFLAEGERRLSEALKRGLPAALMLFDLDRFKQVNDSHGHHAGDCVLQAFAACTGKTLRGRDLFGRIGGEEFAALLIGTTPGDVLDIAERCRAAIEQLEVPHVAQPIRMTVSIGVATVAKSGRDLEGLLGDADHALYEAKSAGRNAVRLNKPRAIQLQLVA